MLRAKIKDPDRGTEERGMDQQYIVESTTGFAVAFL